MTSLSEDEVNEAEYPAKQRDRRSHSNEMHQTAGALWIQTRSENHSYPYWQNSYMQFKKYFSCDKMKIGFLKCINLIFPIDPSGHDNETIITLSQDNKKKKLRNPPKKLENDA